MDGILQEETAFEISPRIIGIESYEKEEQIIIEVWQKFDYSDPLRGEARMSNS